MRSAFGQTRSTIGEMRSTFGQTLRIWPNARAVDQTLLIWSNAVRFVNWSDAQRICPNVQIGQMRLTVVLII